MWKFQGVSGGNPIFTLTAPTNNGGYINICTITTYEKSPFESYWGYIRHYGCPSVPIHLPQFPYTEIKCGNIRDDTEVEAYKTAIINSAKPIQEYVENIVRPELEKIFKEREMELNKYRDMVLELAPFYKDIKDDKKDNNTQLEDTLKQIEELKKNLEKCGN